LRRRCGLGRRERAVAAGDLKPLSSPPFADRPASVMVEPEPEAGPSRTARRKVGPE
jgi:hypothetical protein